jgi:hypothetical protein
MDYAPHDTVRKRHPRGTQVPLTTIVPLPKSTVIHTCRAT